MAKKHKSPEKQVNHVIQSLKDLGVGGKDTLARLATTVRTDAPTLLLGGAKKSAKNDAAKQTIAVRAKASLGRLARQVHPAGEPAAQRQVARELKRLNKRVKLAQQGPKPRKSRLPYVVAVAALMLVSGGYWLVSQISLPQIHVAQYLDYKNWLNHTAGRDMRKTDRLEAVESSKTVSASRTPVLAKPVTAVSQTVKRPVLPPAPRILVHSSSKGAVGAKLARRVQTRIEPARRGKNQDG